MGPRGLAFAEASLKAFNRIGMCLGASLLLGAIASACGGTEGTSGTSSETTTSGSSTTTQSSTNTGGSGGTGTGTGGTGTTTSGSGGTGGTGGGPVAGGHGPPASQLVNGGDVVKSPGYKMVFTLGQPTQNQTKTTSPGYRMQGGLIGATGTLP